MVSFKGKLWLKHYVKKNLTSGAINFSFMMLLGSLVYHFFIYTGKFDPVYKPGVPDLGASSNSVLHLAQFIHPHQKL